MKEIDSVQTSYSPNTRTFLSLEEPKKKSSRFSNPHTSSITQESLPRVNLRSLFQNTIKKELEVKPVEQVAKKDYSIHLSDDRLWIFSKPRP